MSAGTPDGINGGYITNEAITLSTEPTGSAYQWSLAKPQGASSRSDLTSLTDATPQFVPDVHGVWSIACTVDGTIVYLLRVGVEAVAVTTHGDASRYIPVGNGTVPAPALGSTVFHSRERDALAIKLPDGSIELFSFGGTTAAAAVSSWTIDPDNGDDDAPDGGTLATMAELMRRLRGQRIEQYTLVSLPNGLPDEDTVVSGFDVGPDGFMHFKGAVTTLQTGTVTAKTDVAPATNTPADITDSALSADWGALGLIGDRIRITSGARENAATWLLKDLTGKRAMVGYWYPATFTAPPLGNFSPVNAQIGDPYAVESLPVIRSLRCEVDVATGVAGIGRAIRVLFEDLSISSPPGNGRINTVSCNTSDGIGFLNCDLAPRGTSTGGTLPAKGGGVNAIGCNLAYLAPFVTPLGSYRAQGCVSRAAPLSFTGTADLIDCVFVDSTFIDFFSGNSFVDDVGIIDAGYQGFVVWPAAVVQMFGGKLWGSGNSGYGIFVSGGGNFTPYSGSLGDVTLTGTSGDTYVGTVAKTYAELPYVNTADLARIVEHV
jgi:hypothetical protein